MKKISLKNPDGSFNGKLIAGLISLVIVLIQQVLAVFGIKFAGDWTSIVAVVNTVLTILGLLGVVTDVEIVTAPTSQADKAPTSTSVSNVTSTSADIKVDDKAE